MSERITDKDPAIKLARKRLSVLELAQELGSVSKACKQAGMDRTSFYEWKRRFQTHGLEGLKDLPPIVKNHPQTTPPATVERVLALSNGATDQRLQLSVGSLGPGRHRCLVRDGARYSRQTRLGKPV